MTVILDDTGNPRDVTPWAAEEILRLRSVVRSASTGINWSLLRRQKEYLITLSNDLAHCREGMLDGVVGLIDFVQDWNVDQGNATELEVFGAEFVEAKNGNP